MKMRTNGVVRFLAAASLALLASCHTWGFNRPVDMPGKLVQGPVGELRIEDLRKGEGQEVVVGSKVSVQYTGWLADGTQFDSSLDRGVPFEFVVGKGEVVSGWDEGMLGMKVGGQRRIVMPPDRAYGEKGRAGVIPPNATIVLEVELLGVK